MRCGSALAPSAFQSASPYASPYGNGSSSASYSASSTKLKTGLAITSMVLAIIAFPTTFLLIGLLIAPIAIILGIVALRKASKQPHVYGGKGFAIAGIAVGGIVCVFFAPIIAAIAIPNFMAARRAANEGNALHVIQKLTSVQQQQLFETGACSTLSELGAKNLVPQNVASGKKNGYNYSTKVSDVDSEECQVNATPESSSEGTRAFYMSTSEEVVRVSTDGSPADASDPPVEARRASR